MADLFELFRKITQEKQTPSEPVTRLVVGLGNCGEKYTNTRHNAGFLALDAFAAARGIRINRSRFHALVGDATVGGHHVLFMKPQTLMNASGLAVQEAADFYRVAPENILVISDDISLPVGAIRVRRKGSAGGHNGLKDIIACIGSEEFPRIRIGIGAKPHPDYDLAAWVLSEFSSADRETLAGVFGCVDEGILKILAGDFDGAMQLCNSHHPEDGTAQ